MTLWGLFYCPEMNMKAIKCKNLYKDENGKQIECGRMLAILTDLQVDILKIDTEKPVFRCPKCHPEDRWLEIGYDESGKLIFKVLEKHPEFKPEDNLQYEELEIITQVG